MFAANASSGGGTKVVNPQDVLAVTTYSGNGGTQTITNGLNLATDGGLVILKARSNVGVGANDNNVFDTVRGATNYLQTNTANSNATDSASVTSFNSDGFSLGASSNRGNSSSASYVAFAFKKQAGFFDIITWTGNGSTSSRMISHSLGTTPGLIIAKATNSSNVNTGGSWLVWHKGDGTTPYTAMSLNSSSGGSQAYSTNADVTSSAVDVYTALVDFNGNHGNASGLTYTAYLFSAMTGLSSIGAYTGNGSSQTINCGFTAGARFVMIKRVDATGGEFYVWDSVRGIVAANDPYISLTSSAVEVTTDDSIDPASTGFIVNNVGSNINVNSAQYIYLAIA